jgi:hypothetical protein
MMTDQSEPLPQPLLSPATTTPTPTPTPATDKSVSLPFPTRHVFRQGAERLVRVMEGIDSDSLDPHKHTLCDWSIESGLDNRDDVYLVHPVLVRRSSRSRDNAQHDAACNDNAGHLQVIPVDEVDSTEEVLWSDESVINDPDVVVKGLTDEMESSDFSDSESEWNFSIVYSETWRVPVLYFSVQQRDGTPCTRNLVLEILQGEHSHSHSHQNQVTDSWDFVSHEEHPVSRCPAFFLHPCRTQERLETLLQTANSSISDEALRLLSWMSMIFPSVGCSISSRTFQQIRDGLLLD